MSTVLASLKNSATDALDYLKLRCNIQDTPFDFVDARHFIPQTDPEVAKTLFKDSIDMVEIETFSYCNRRCWFCPNAEFGRTGPNRYMDEALYLTIVGELNAIGFDRKISFSRYNEPLADRIILRRLEQARAACPNALLHINTNGDFLNRRYLDALYAKGLRSLNIQVYLGNRQRYDHDHMRRLMQRKIRFLGLDGRLTIDRHGDRIETALVYEDMKLRIYGRNFDVNGSHRGETVQVGNQPVRTSPCLSPFYHLYIDYDGSVVPCCNLRSDIPRHTGTVLGKLTETPSIFAIYAGAKAAAWRRALVGFEPKQGLCHRCSFVPLRPSPSNRHVQAKLASLARAAEGGSV